jgi:hypothetical protein
MFATFVLDPVPTVDDVAPCINIERDKRRPVANLNDLSTESVARPVCAVVLITTALR